jgi:hypothetical protein
MRIASFPGVCQPDQDYHPNCAFRILLSDLSLLRTQLQQHITFPTHPPINQLRDSARFSDLGFPAMGEKHKVVVTRRLIAEAQKLLDTVPDLDVVQWPSEQVRKTPPKYHVYVADARYSHANDPGCWNTRKGHQAFCSCCQTSVTRNLSQQLEIN